MEGAFTETFNPKGTPVSTVFFPKILWKTYLLSSPISFPFSFFYCPSSGWSLSLKEASHFFVPPFRTLQLEDIDAQEASETTALKDENNYHLLEASTSKGPD